MASRTQATGAPAGPEDREIARLDRLADALDTRFRMPLIGVRFGWDGILGLVPVVGDTLTVLPSVWLVLRARRLGAPRSLVAGMIARTGIDYVVGTVPLLGDLFDLGFKANRRNVDALRRHLAHRQSLDQRPPRRSPAPRA